MTHIRFSVMLMMLIYGVKTYRPYRKSQLHYTQDVNLQVNTQHDRNAKTTNKRIENMFKFKYLERTATGHNRILEDGNSK
jgi:hypothetical protein